MNDDLTQDENYHKDYLNPEEGAGQDPSNFSATKQSEGFLSGVAKRAADSGTISGMQEAIVTVMREAATTTLADNSEAINLGETRILQKPIKDDFGEWRREKEYIRGVTPADIVREGGAVEFSTITDDGTTRTVEIAKTPPGLSNITSAGNLGEYLMLVRVQESGIDPTTGQPKDPKFVPRYLDRADLDGVVFKKQKPNEPRMTEFGKNPTRGENGRQIQIPGQVTSVRSLH